VLLNVNTALIDDVRHYLGIKINQLTEYQTHTSDRDKEVETHRPWNSVSLVVIEQQI
jgi:hypothetical protein